jgi:hypothetical protein
MANPRGLELDEALARRKIRRLCYGLVFLDLDVRVLGDDDGGSLRLGDIRGHVDDKTMGRDISKRSVQAFLYESTHS